MRRKKHLTTLLCVAFFVLICLSSVFIFSISANNAPTPPQIQDGGAYCLYDKTHKKMIVSQNESDLRNTSTSAKIMMGLIACELLGDKLDQTVTITEAMIAGVEGYSMKLKPGENISVRDLLYGAICGSYNDAAYALAHICGDSTQGFVDLMNERALKVGATSTHYENPIGYPDNAAMVTTLSDTLKIALAASENPLYMEISSAKHHDISANNLSAARTVYNRNYLISSRSTQAYYNSACSGMNAGISGEAGGWSVITLAEDEGIEYICIVLGGGESPDGGEIYAYNTVNTLVNWARETYNSYKVFSKGQILGKAEIEMTALGSNEVDYATAEDLSVYIPDHSNPDVTYKVEYISDKLCAPIKKGEKIGTVSVFCNGEFVGKCDIVLTEDCEANGIMKIINAIGGYTKSRAFIVTLIILIIAIPIAVIKEKRHARGTRRHHTKY